MMLWPDLAVGSLPQPAPGPKSPSAGLTLYTVLEELQLLLAVMVGACPTCHRPINIHDLVQT